MKTNIVIAISISLLTSCIAKSENKEIADTTEETKSKMNPPSQAELIIDEAIDAHGGDLYNSANYSFVFRGSSYQFKNEGNNYEYSKSSNKDSVLINDVLNADGFFRTINGDAIELTEKEVNGATGAINSVIYFATLPHKLKDESVNKSLIGETMIKEANYAIIGVTFSQEGGGEDFEDRFYYWINTETKMMDYFAYDYKVNGGGVRFRSAYNRRLIDGVTFQDYINYEAETGTELNDLPALYEAGQLKEVSRIETESIINLNNK
jgi:hypothetical protein